MKTESDKQKFLAFFGFLVVVALTVNFLFMGKFHIRPTQTQLPQQQFVAEKSPLEDEAVKRQQIAARLYDTSFTRKPGTTALAVLAADEDGKINQSINTALANHFRSGSTQIQTSFFKLEFVSTGVFSEILDGSNEFFDTMEIAKKLDATVFARQTVTYSQTAELNNLISATVKLDITLIPLSSHGDRKKWSFTAYGPGFSKEVARGAAEERLIKQITDDTKMVLNQ